MSYKIYYKNSPDDKVYPLMYEVNMFNEAFDLYCRTSEKDWMPKSLFLEIFLLHARILIDFIEDNRTKSSKDDLTCADFVDTNNYQIKGKTVDLKADIKIALNKHLAHLTKERLTKKPVWNVLDIKQKINEALKIFIKDCSDSNFPNNPSLWRNVFDEQLSR